MQVRVRSGPREVRFPRLREPLGEGPSLARSRDDDDALGLAIWRMLAEALGRGVPPPAVVLLTDEQVHLVDIVPLLQGGETLDGRAIAGFAGVAGVETMAVLGVLTRRHRGVPSGRFAVAFVEWPDGRWWLGRRAIVDGPDGRLLVDPLAEVEVDRAVDGASKPGGLGGWFRRVRVEGLRVALRQEIEN